MAAELCKLKFILATATLLLLLLLSVIVYYTVTDAFVLESDLASEVEHDVSSERHYYDDEDVDHSRQSSEIGSKQASDVVAKVPTGHFCEVMWKNRHLLRSAAEKRETAILCRWTRLSVAEIETEGVAAGQDYSDPTSNVNKLTERCKHQERIDNNDVRRILLRVCRDINKADTIMPAESFRKVTTEHVTTASDATTVAAVEAVTSSPAVTDVVHIMNTSISSLLTSASDSTTIGAVEVATSSPAVTDVVHSMDTADIWEVACHNVHLVNGSTDLKLAISLLCQVKIYEDEGNLNVTGWTSSVPEDLSLSSRESGLIKLRWICAHADQAKQLHWFPQLLPYYCPIIDELDVTTQPPQLTESTPHDESVR